MEVLELVEGALLALIMVKTLSYLDTKYKTTVMNRRKANQLLQKTPKKVTIPKLDIKTEDIINPEAKVVPTPI